MKVGRDLISKVTDGGDGRRARVGASGRWRTSTRSIFLDALVLKIREGGSVQRRACYLALGVTLEGDRDVLGLWFQETEGAKFWMQVLTELKQRGVQRHPDLLRRRAEGLPRGDRGDLPQDHRPNVHRAPDPPLPEVRAAPRARAGRPRPETDLHRRRRRRRPARARGASTRSGGSGSRSSPRRG